MGWNNSTAPAVAEYGEVQSNAAGSIDSIARGVRIDESLLDDNAPGVSTGPSDAELRWAILELVRTSEGIRISEIAERLQTSLSEVAGLVRELRMSGYLGPAE